MTCNPRAGQLIKRMFDAALRAADPVAAVSRTIQTIDGDLAVEETMIPIGGKLVVVAIGKAAERMAAGAVAALGERIDAGYVVTKATRPRHSPPQRRAMSARRVSASTMASATAARSTSASR